ncbi:conserved protein, UPF0502 family [Escherichia coli]|uniref:Conserved protein, UPF0502 family n=1 Tax=Escherichia coli TaxID=562 RepID=A0A377KA28_ECOLX|nr:conserved protein, UPF0502 family [Escherichia coli]
MKYQLTAMEARVIGCLLEKQVTTPGAIPALRKWCSHGL